MLGSVLVTRNTAVKNGWPGSFPQGTYNQVGESDTKHMVKQLII